MDAISLLEAFQRWLVVRRMPLVLPAVVDKQFLAKEAREALLLRFISCVNMNKKQGDSYVDCAW